MRLRVPLGTSDFLQLRQDKLVYVDKSQFVVDVLGDPVRVLLLPRPRRFGKTLNLTTLRAFVERPIGPALPGESADHVRRAFSGLTIEAAGEDVWRRFQRHPVICLTFKDLKGPNWSVRESFVELISREAQRLKPAVDASLGPDDRRRLESLISGTATIPVLERSLLVLSEWLHVASGEQVVILIDEYDTPIHDVYGDDKRYEEVVGFFRNFLSAGLKDNPHLEKGVLTGILRVAKESMFSGLNNLEVYSLLKKPYATSFGFTEVEVKDLCLQAGLATAEENTLRSWYNGYRFGGQVIYNPWSVLSFLKQADEPAQPYWVNTGGDALLRKLLVDAGLGIEAEIEALLAGGSITKPIDEHIVLREIDTNPDAVFSFLLFTGYLRAEERLEQESGKKPLWRLCVPNKEVASVYEDLFSNWLKRGLGGGESLQAFTRALLAGEASAVEQHLGTLLERTLSYHDTGIASPGSSGATAGKAREVVYQAFVAGLLVVLEKTHLVRSNRESGLGRADVLITPRQAGNPGVVLELKVLGSGETMEHALAAALAQIRTKKYVAELQATGANPVVELACVFDRKAVRVARG